jgi:hypothetical protein
MKTILLFYCALPAAFTLTLQTPEAGSPADLPYNAEQSPNPADIVKRWLKVDSVQQLNCLNNGVGQYDKLYDCGGNEGSHEQSWGGHDLTPEICRNSCFCFRGNVVCRVWGKCNAETVSAFTGPFLSHSALQY